MILMSDLVRFPEVFIKHFGILHYSRTIQCNFAICIFQLPCMLHGRFGTKQLSCLWVPQVPHHFCSGWNGFGLWDGVEINQIWWTNVSWTIVYNSNNSKTFILGTVSCVSPYEIITSPHLFPTSSSKTKTPTNQLAQQNLNHIKTENYSITLNLKCIR